MESKEWALFIWLVPKHSFGFCTTASYSVNPDEGQHCPQRKKIIGPLVFCYLMVFSGDQSTGHPAHVLEAEDSPVWTFF